MSWNYQLMILCKVYLVYIFPNMFLQDKILKNQALSKLRIQPGYRLPFSLKLVCFFSSLGAFAGGASFGSPSAFRFNGALSLKCIDSCYQMVNFSIYSFFSRLEDSIAVSAFFSTLCALSITGSRASWGTVVIIQRFHNS